MIKTWRVWQTTLWAYCLSMTRAVISICRHVMKSAIRLITSNNPGMYIFFASLDVETTCQRIAGRTKLSVYNALEMISRNAYARQKFSEEWRRVYGPATRVILALTSKKPFLCVVSSHLARPSQSSFCLSPSGRFRFSFYAPDMKIDILLIFVENSSLCHCGHVPEMIPNRLQSCVSGLIASWSSHYEK